MNQADMQPQLSQVAENITFDPKSDQMSLLSAWIFGTTSVLGFIVSTESLAYIYFKLKLNKYMKLILAITVGVNLLSSILNVIALMLFVTNGYFTVWTCRLNAYSTVPLLTTINMLNSISILRYYMSHLASKTKILKASQAVIFIVFTIISNYGMSIGVILWHEYFEGRSAVTMCMNEEHFPSQPTVGTLALFKIIMVVIYGLVCDISLFFFVKKSNKVEDIGTKMVPWKTPSDATQAENDLQIPIRASILSSVFLLISGFLMIVVMILITKSSSPSELVYWCTGSFIIVSSCGAPVAMMVLTVKTQSQEKTKVSNAQPPQKLQFHEPSDDEENQKDSDRSKENEFEMSVINQNVRESLFL